MFKLRYISLLLTLVIVALFFIVNKDVIFESKILIILVPLIFSTGIIFNFYAIIELEGYETVKGKMQKEKIHTLSFSVLIVFFLLSIISFINYFFEVSPISIIILYALIAFVIIVGIIQYLADFVLLNENGFESRYIINLKKKSVRFDEITEVKFGSLMNVITVKTSNITAYIDITIKGVEKILNEISIRTSIEIHKIAFENLGKYYKGYFFSKNLQLLRYFDSEENNNEEKAT